MNYLEIIKNLSSKDNLIDTVSIKKWLNENRNYLKKSIENTKCHKWRKWERNNSLHIFPCISHLCGNRNEECRFIEFSNDLITYVSSLRNEDFYKNLLENYNKIKHNQNAVFEWVIDNKTYGEELTDFKDTVIFKDEKNKKLLSFKLDQNELINLWSFKKIFQNHYYSFEFEDYTK